MSRAETVPEKRRAGRARRVFLVGMMGAGKTTVGRLLADRLGWRYADSDDAVERRTGRTVRELFEAGGEGAFRPLETEALYETVAGEGPMVVAVAGGAVLDPANRALLRRSGTVVWLRASPATLARRVADDVAAPHGHRPLLEEDPEATLARLDAERRALYEDVADVTVDVDDLDPEAVVERVAAALRS
jgi:shikimate kinase